MRYSSLLLRTALLASAFLVPVHADILLDLPNEAFTGSEPTLTARMLRDGIISDWSTQKTWPGNSGVAGPFGYLTYSIPVIYTNKSAYIQISVDDPTTGVFASAYANAYVPQTGTNYLGDIGFSGNNLGNPGFFQVVLPANKSLVIVINRTLPSQATPVPFGLLVEGFSSTQYDPLYATPEPFAYGLSLSAIGLLLVARRRKANGGIA